MALNNISMTVERLILYFGSLFCGVNANRVKHCGCLIISQWTGHTLFAPKFIFLPFIMSFFRSVANTGGDQ